MADNAITNATGRGNAWCTSLSLKAHPVSFARQKLTLLGTLSTGQVMQSKAGATVKVSGIVISRQRPGTAGGVCFMTIEDEYATVNLVLFENCLKRTGRRF